MHQKNVLVACGDSLSPDRVRRLFSSMDVEVRVLTASLHDALQASRGFGIDLLLVDATSQSNSISSTELENLLVDGGQTSLLMLIPGEKLRSFHLPVRIPSDFAVADAGDDEVKLRCHQLLWPGEVTTDADFIHVGPMTVNLATYQVKVDGNPIDLTFMEYALLSFLVTHPGRIWSREVLLSQVWGFDYYGGSRTVDVHVRRLRAKLGPEAAQHLETVRGAGYLWVN